MQGTHDRRFFDPLLKSLLVLIVASLLLLIFWSWRLGLAAVLFSCVSFITLEAISAPPANRPDCFLSWSRRQSRRRPVLLCLGDGLTHGNSSASFTPEIPRQLCAKLGMAPPAYGATFSDPIWVVNAGQNGLSTQTVLRERLNHALGTYPDYILIWIGSNDVRAMYSKFWAGPVRRINRLDSVPSVSGWSREVHQLIQFIRQASPLVRIGVCTLPPLGERLSSRANEFVRDANAALEQAVAHDERVTVIPVFARMESELEKRRRTYRLSPDTFPVIMMLCNVVYHLSGGLVSWNRLSSITGGVYLYDGVHLNERGADLVAELVVDWLLRANVAKAIAIKSSF